MAELLFTLITWINSQDVINPVIPQKPPRVMFLEKNDFLLASYYCLMHEHEDKDMMGYDYKRMEQMIDGTIGLYCDDNIFIRKVEETNYGDVDYYLTKMYILHELVHWMQDYNGDMALAPCIAHTEKDAYTLSRMWLGENGHEPWPDDFTLFIYSQCNPHSY